MSFHQRTIMAGELRSEHIGQRIILKGWVDGHRDFGGMYFIDIRDRSGKAQCVLGKALWEGEKDESKHAANVATVFTLRSEFVVCISGTVRMRSNKNPNIPTGDVEVEIESIDILNKSEVPPFEVKEDTTANEDLRLKYRYLDLRRPSLQNNLAARHKIVKSIRDYFDERGFYEIETPILMKATPEGARDFWFLRD